MDYKKKYKEALEKAKKLYGKYCINNVLEDLFPELKESEDERIRKEIIDFVKSKGGFKGDWIAWLEKQCEKKPAENVEIKFCEGDKIVSNQDGKVYTVGTAYWVNGDNICLHGTDGNHLWTNEDDLDKNYHLWTLKDAKAGDVLVCKGNIKDSNGIKYERICLFNNLDNAFFTLTKTSNYIEEYNIDVNVNADYPDNTIPATKGQKEILFMVMKEAGYEWDADKKELKKIEPKKVNVNKVVKWLNDQACLGWLEDVEVEKVVEQFKKDFGL